MKKKVVIIGGGSSALLLGCELDPKKFEVHVFESNAALGRKFLVAGDGGLNLTHSQEAEIFIKQYTPHEFLHNAFSHFNNQSLIKWLNDKGIKTYTGTSGRVFPDKGIKPIDVLNIFIEQLKKNGVFIHTKHQWNGFSNSGELLFLNQNEEIKIRFDIVIFCLGGASWPVTGSKGDWTKHFEQKKIKTEPFIASNCAYQINWDPILIKKIEGKNLKNISITCNNKTHFGEIVITKAGIEGSGIYPLSPQIRSQLLTNNDSEIYIDLKPNTKQEVLYEKIKKLIDKKEFTENLKKDLNLNSTHINLLKAFISKEDFLNPKKLAFYLKNFPLKITGLGPIEDAISTVGGINLKEIDEYFELKKLKSHYCIGEMLDYDAPTGGYLLQSCFSMAKYLSHILNGTN